MNAVNFENNYHTLVSGVNVYVDYFSSRLKIIDSTQITGSSIKEIIKFSRKEKLGKIITRCTVQMLRTYISSGFTIEGYIQGFLRGEDAYFVSYFINKNREEISIEDEEDAILRKISMSKSYQNRRPSKEFIIRNAVSNDIPQIIKLFAAVFKTYPSPVFSSEYLKKAMNDNVIFKVAVYEDKIVSIASAEMDLLNLNAEITDCATYENFRGNGLLPCLIENLELDLKYRGFYTSYSLCRSINPGINLVLEKLNYKFCGKLINNCHICGSFESMNIWAKSLNAI